DSWRGWLFYKTRSLAGLCRALPQHIVTEFLGLGAHGGQCGELAVEDFVGMGFFVILERAPIGHDDIVIVCGFGRIEGSFGGEKARELEDLPRDEAPFATAVGFLDDAAQFSDRHLHIVERDAGLELHGVEQHFDPEGNGYRSAHVILLHETRSLARCAGGIYDATYLA